MIPVSPLLEFTPTQGVHYDIQPSGAWTLYTKHADTTLIVVRKYIESMMTENHTICIVDVSDNNRTIDITDTYESTWSAMDAIGICLMKEDAQLKWLDITNNQVVVGMTFQKHKLPYGIYQMTKGKLQMIASEMGNTQWHQ